MTPVLIIKRAIELFVEPWDTVPADDASDEEWDAAFEAHCRKIDARKAAGGAWKPDWLLQIEKEWERL